MTALPDLNPRPHLAYAVQCLGNRALRPKYAKTWEQLSWFWLIYAVQEGEL